MLFNRGNRYVVIFVALLFAQDARCEFTQGVDHAAMDYVVDAVKVNSADMPPDESISGRYRITAIMEIFHGEEMSALVGIIDQNNNNSFLLAQGKTRDGLKLISVDYEKQKVQLRHGGETFTLELAESSPGRPAVLEGLPMRRPGVVGTPNPREDAAMALRRARYAQPPPTAAEASEAQ